MSYTKYQVRATHPVAGSKWDWSETPQIVEAKFEDGWPNNTGFICKSDDLGMSSIIDCQSEERAIALWLQQHGMTAQHVEEVV